MSRAGQGVSAEDAATPDGVREPATSSATLAAVLSAAALSAAGMVAAMGLGAARQVVAARAFGPEGFGIISLAESFENVLIKVAPLGLSVSLPLLLARAIAGGDRNEAGRVLGTAAYLGAPLIALPGVVFLLGGQSLADGLGTPEAGPVLRIWGLVVIGLGVCQLAAAALRGLLRIGASTLVREVLPNALLLACLWAGLAAGMVLPGIATAYAAGALIAAFIAVLVARGSAKRLGVHVAANSHMVGPLLRLTWPTLTMVMAGQLMRQINLPILTAVSDLTTVGLFNAALFMATATEAIFISLTLVYMPYANKLLVESGPAALAAVQSAIGRWTFLVSLAPIALLSAFADSIMTAVFPASFAPASLPLRIILVGLLVRAVVGPRNSVQLALDRGRDVSVSFLVSLAIVVVLAIALSPTLGMVGSAISFAAGFSVRAIVSEVQLRRVLPGSAMQPRELAAAATISLFVVAAFTSGTALALLLPLAALALNIVIFLATLDATDRDLLTESWRRLTSFRRRQSR